MAVRERMPTSTRIPASAANAHRQTGDRPVYNPSSTPGAVTTRVMPGPRERLLEAAKELTYEQGVIVGVGALL